MYRRCACLRGARRALARSTCAKGAGGLPRLRAIANLSRYACCCWMCVLSSAVRTRLRSGKKWRSGRRQTDCMSSVCLCVVGAICKLHLCAEHKRSGARLEVGFLVNSETRHTEGQREQPNPLRIINKPNSRTRLGCRIENFETLTVNRLGRFQETTRYVGVERVERYVLLK